MEYSIPERLQKNLQDLEQSAREALQKAIERPQDDVFEKVNNLVALRQNYYSQQSLLLQGFASTLPEAQYSYDPEKGMLVSEEVENGIEEAQQVSA